VDWKSLFATWPVDRQLEMILTIVEMPRSALASLLALLVTNWPHRIKFTLRLSADTFAWAPQYRSSTLGVTVSGEPNRATIEVTTLTG
jgi:hypothetical protein